MTKFDTQVKKLLTENSKEEPVMTVDGYGNKRWRLKNNNYHREDGPAVIKANGDKIWYINGERHREGGPAAEYSNGDKWWYKNGKIHREDGPAIEWVNGTKMWYMNDEPHREDGPAVIYPDGYKEWWVNGIPLSEDHWRARESAKKDVPPEHQQNVLDILDL